MLLLAEGVVEQERERVVEEVREEVRPGLVMVKRRTLKEDGRYLLYYSFEEEPEESEP